MSIVDSRIYDDTGRMRGGSFVYMLLCQDEGPGPIYVKVGFSDTPLRRLNELRQGCPVTPRQFAFVSCRGKNAALKLERDLLDAFDRWHTSGEWIRLKKEEKTDFNMAWKATFRAQPPRALLDLRWDQVNVSEWEKLGQRRKKFVQSMYRKGGKAYQDFTRHGGIPSHLLRGQKYCAGT